MTSPLHVSERSMLAGERRVETKGRLAALLARTGIARSEASAWLSSWPDDTASLDARLALEFLSRGEALLEPLPPRRRRSAAESELVEAMQAALGAVRRRLLHEHVDRIYREATEGYRRHLRLDDLLSAVSARYPGLVADRRAVARDRKLPLRDKGDLERADALLLQCVLQAPRPSAHFLASMQRPLPASADALEEFLRTGSVELGLVRVYRQGSAALVEMTNHRSLNAEDNEMLAALEVGADVALLSDAEVCVLRGAPMLHPRYRGRRVFSSGLNLTKLLDGEISLVFFAERELGVLNKIYRGLATGAAEAPVEKPWVAIVEEFAIGGGCQHLLVMDHVIAAERSYITLPAALEGLIPGAAPLRLTAALGDRLTRQLLFSGKRIEVASDAGRALCDDVVPTGDVDAALDASLDAMQRVGRASFVANRRLLRESVEPLQAFVAYVARYVLEQIELLLDPTFATRLEETWSARRRVATAAA